jgi:cell division protein FtsW
LLAVVTGLVLVEPDYGTSVTLVLIAAVIILAAGLSWRHALTLGGAVGVLGALALVIESYRVRRLLIFLDPWQDPQKDGYQLIQSLYAVGSGGVTGVGLMEGKQKLFYLPYPYSDFIYSVIGEELGLVGATVILLCFCLIAWRGLRVAGRAPDSFGGLLAIGLTTMIAAQALVNISVVLGLLPTKGIPLPFISAGGSSLLVQMIGLGILLNISQQASAAN